MKRLIIDCCIAFLLCSIFVEIAEAKQYRCAGRVQYRPCERNDLEGAPIPPPAPTRAPSPKPKHGVAAPQTAAARLLYAKILSQQFKQHTPYEGVWSGIVEGNGDVHLQLQLKRNGRLEDTWYMGHVRLVNNATSFKFVALPPKGSNWSWNIIASAS